MTEQLGELKKPSAESFGEGRKLFFVPLVLGPRETEPELKELIERYWAQVQDHVTNLEAKLGQVKRVYHELVPAAGEEAVKAVEELSTESCQLVKAAVQKGAQLESMEDSDLLTELMDWTKCLALGLQNQRVFNLVYESFVAVEKKRNEHITGRIDETLQSDETGILVMREGHQVQFPADVQVFYVAPPALDEIKRWARAREAQPRPEAGQESEGGGEVGSDAETAG